MREHSWQPWTPGRSVATPELAPVIGHRGAAARAPENTLAGLRKAHELGTRWVEFDVMLTADGVPILIHDETLDRTTSGHGPVPAHSLAEIRTLDAGAWFAAALAGEKVPTLEETIALLLELGLHANVEIKPARGQAAVTARATVETLLRLWPADGPRLLISSFARESLAVARDLAPDIPRGLLAETQPADWAEALQALGCATLHLNHKCSTPAMLQQLRQAGVPVLFYTVNDAGRARDLFAAGATALITDTPDLLLGMAAAQ